jgi:hypothetical protein
MNCADFEKWLFENPKERKISAEMKVHLDGCDKCAGLWKVENILFECPKYEEKLSLSPQIRAALIKAAKRESAGRYSFSSILEDSVIQALILSIFLVGGIAALSKIASPDIIAKIRPFAEPVLNAVNPFYVKMASIFSFSGGVYLLTFVVFSIIFSLEVYFKTILTKPSYLRS